MARGRAANGSGMQPRKRSDGRWEVRFSCGIDPATGKTKTKSIYGKTAAEVAEKLRRATADVDAGDYLDPQKMKLSEWLHEWLKAYCVNIKPSTLIQYRSYVRNHIDPALGALPLCRLQPHHVQEMINRLGRCGHGKKALSYKTKKNIHGCLSAALNKAVEIHYVKENAATGCSIPRGNDAADTKQVHPFTAGQAMVFMKLAEESPYFNVYFLALNTGMRLSEILGLRWSRIDFTNGRITVDAQLLLQREKGESRKLGQTKNRKARSFKVAPQVLEILSKVKKGQLESRMKAGSAWNNSLDLVFTDGIGGSLPHSSIEHDFRRITIKQGIPERRFHDLRHTFATEALRHGADVKTLSEALGHYSTAFTLDCYAHISEEMADNFAALMASVIAER